MSARFSRSSVAVVLGALSLAAACGGREGRPLDASAPVDGSRADGGSPDAGGDPGGDVLATGSAAGLALDDERIYWAAWLGGEVRSATKGGGDPVPVLDDVTGPTHVARAGEHVYAVSDEEGFTATLSRAPASGAGAGGETVDAQARKCCLAADGAAVYWLQERGPGPDALMRLSPEGTPEEVEAEFPEFVAAAGGALWIAEGVQLRAYVVGEETVPVATFPETVHGVTADATAAFVLTSDEAGTASLWSVPRAGGDPALLWSGAGVSYEPAPTALDDTHVYFPVGDPATYPYGSLLRVPRGGGEAETMARRQPWVADIEVDDTHVFWSNRGVGGAATDTDRLGRVMRAPK